MIALKCSTTRWRAFKLLLQLSHEIFDWIFHINTLASQRACVLPEIGRKIDVDINSLVCLSNGSCTTGTTTQDHTKGREKIHPELIFFSAHVDPDRIRKVLCRWGTRRRGCLKIVAPSFLPGGTRGRDGRDEGGYSLNLKAPSDPVAPCFSFFHRFSPSKRSNRLCLAVCVRNTSIFAKTDWRFRY